MNEKATFAAGCFWGVEAAFDQINGVLSTCVGYCGGVTENPTYREVCTGMTKHAESVEVVYDPQIVGYEELLSVFFKIHDPTQLNRQGVDVGTQYRSVVFYHSEQQRVAAASFIDSLNESGLFKRNIVTQLVKASPFYPAEEYHQKYLKKNPGINCHI